MRDYNAIQFRSPTQKKPQAVLASAPALSRSPVPERVGSSSTAASTASLPLAPPMDASARTSSTTASRTPAPTSSPPLSPRNQERSQSQSPPPKSTIEPLHPTHRSSSPMGSGSNIARPPTPPPAPPSTSPMSIPNGSVVSTSSTATMSPADALAMRREGPEVVIARMRQQLDTMDQSTAKSKASVAKSDAVILELRSTVRQLKRQLENPKNPANAPNQSFSSNSVNRTIHSSMSQDGSTNSQHSNGRQQQQRDAAAAITELQVQLDRAHAQLATADMVRKELEDTLEAEQYTWELRVQDQEREITELSNHVNVLQQEIDQTVATERKAVAASGSNKAMESGSMDDGQIDQLDWKEKLMELERERHELQGCLDEALKELEAVDAELQNDGAAALREENERLQKLLRTYEEQQAANHDRGIGASTSRGAMQENNQPNHALEPLQHLYRWMLEREGKSDDSIHLKLHDTSADIISEIQAFVEHSSSTVGHRTTELEQQLSVYQEDSRAREETCSELRTNLKEAVALLKPLQENAVKADREKAKLQDQLVKAQSGEGAALAEIRNLKQRLNAREDELDQLRQDVETLELQLSHAKLAAANQMITQQNNSNATNNHDRSLENVASPRDMASGTSPSGAAVDELRAKRQSEHTLKNLLRDAQSRFMSLQQQNQQVSAMNNELQGRLREAVDTSADSNPSVENMQKLQESIRTYESRIKDLERETASLRAELSRKDDELEKLQDDLSTAKVHFREVTSSGGSEAVLRQAEARVRQLESELAEKSRALAEKRDTERILNKSLKDALGLIKPLQMHLEEAEHEKRAIAQELMIVRNNTSGVNGSRSAGSTADMDVVRDLEVTVRHLEKENAQLQDALEDMSQSLNASHLNGVDVSSQSPRKSPPQQDASTSKAESRLREEIVELKSRYEVTQARLQEAFVENHSLSDSLTKRAHNDGDLALEVGTLRDKLKTAEEELANAKFVATSALVKIDELSMAEQLSYNSADQERLYKQKERQLDQEMRLVRQHQSSVPYRLT